MTNIIMTLCTRLLFYLCLGGCVNLNAGDISIDRLLVSSAVGEANVGLHNSPITTHKNSIYVAYVETDESSVNRTVVSKYKVGSGWQKSIVEPNTMNNPYHAQPSMAIDTDGFIHLTYNMHSSPWQYSVSKQIENIEAWSFLGQELNGPHEDLASAAVVGEGTAAIPGNRITYQYMVVDRNGDLFISFREALKTEKGVKYADRQWSLGIAKYDVKSKVWKRVGEDGLSLPFATEPGYRPQVAHIYFDKMNGMHITWNWYVEYALDGSNKKNVISYAFSDDGGNTFKTTSNSEISIPLRREPSEKIVEPDFYLSFTKAGATKEGLPIVLVMPKPPSLKARSLVMYDKILGWNKQVRLPHGATNFYVDDHNVITAVSSGLRVHRSEDFGRSWTTFDIDIESGPYTIWFDRVFINKTNNLRFLAQSGKENSLYVYTVVFDGELSPPQTPTDFKGY